MKKLIVLVITFLILQGCVDYIDYNVKNSVAIVNNSGKDIEVLSYDNYNGGGVFVFSKKIIIMNNNKYGEAYKTVTNESTAHAFEGLVRGDSIVIDYGDKVKSYSYKNLEDERNPFYLNLQNKANDFIFTLTPADYANATLKQ